MPYLIHQIGHRTKLSIMNNNLLDKINFKNLSELYLGPGKKRLLYFPETLHYIEGSECSLSFFNRNNKTKGTLTSLSVFGSYSSTYSTNPKYLCIESINLDSLEKPDKFHENHLQIALTHKLTKINKINFYGRKINDIEHNKYVQTINTNKENLLIFKKALLEFVTFELEEDKRVFFELSDIRGFNLYFQLDWTIQEFIKKRNYKKREIDIVLLHSLNQQNNS